MKFKSRKDTWIALLFYAIVVLSIWISLEAMVKGGLHKWPVAVLMLLPAGFLLWLLHGTYYTLSNQKLCYYSGPIRGEIDINTIQEIRANTTLWVGLKVATARNGLIIKYNKYDEIYISPDTNASFIAALKASNAKIVVV